VLLRQDNAWKIIHFVVVSLGFLVLRASNVWMIPLTAVILMQEEWIAVVYAKNSFAVELPRLSAQKVLTVWITQAITVIRIMVELIVAASVLIAVSMWPASLALIVTRDTEAAFLLSAATQVKNQASLATPCVLKAIAAVP